MQAIILAAGMGRRLKQLTEHQPKCMVPVNKIPLIERMLRQLDQYDLEKIILVTGHKGELLRSFVESLSLRTPVVFIDKSGLRNHQQHLFPLSGQRLSP